MPSSWWGTQEEQKCIKARLGWVEQKGHLLFEAVPSCALSLPLVLGETEQRGLGTQPGLLLRSGREKISLLPCNQQV